MQNISGLIAGQDLYTSSEFAAHQVGILGYDALGNRYRYVKNGGSELVAGNLLQEPVENTDFEAMAVVEAAAIGATKVKLTLGSTATTASLLDGGLLLVAAGAGIGQMFRIEKFEIADAAASCIFTLDRPLETALAIATSTVSVRKSPFNGVIQYPVTTQTGGAVGVAIHDLTAEYHGWIQSGGEASVLFDSGTNTSNGVSGLAPSAAVAGSVKPQTGGEGGIVIGYSRIVVSTDSEHGLAHLTID